MGAVTAQLHGSFVARTIPEWNRLPAAAAEAVSPTLFHARLNAIPENTTYGRVFCRRRCLHNILCVIRHWLSFDSRQKAVLQIIAQDKTSSSSSSSPRYTFFFLLFFFSFVSVSFLFFFSSCFYLGIGASNFHSPMGMGSMLHRTFLVIL